MPKYFIRKRITRIHHFIIEAENQEEAEEIAKDLDEDTSTTDMFDEDDVLDVTEEPS